MIPINKRQTTSRTSIKFECGFEVALVRFVEFEICDVLNESGSVKSEVKVRQKKTGKNTLLIPLSKNSVDTVKKYLLEREQDDYIFKGQMSHFTRKPISTQQYAKIVKKWLRELGVEDVSEYSTHSMRKTKPSVIYQRTNNVDAVRRLLGQSSVTATSAYLGVSDNSALELARNINF